MHTTNKESALEDDARFFRYNGARIPAYKVERAW